MTSNSAGIKTFEKISKLYTNTHTHKQVTDNGSKAPRSFPKGQFECKMGKEMWGFMVFWERSYRTVMIDSAEATGPAEMEEYYIHQILSPTQQKLT